MSALEFWLVRVPGSRSRSQVHAFPAPDEQPLATMCGVEVDRGLVEQTTEGMPCVRCLMKVADGIEVARSQTPAALLDPVLLGLD
ncbi:hypothetical protein GCM10012275_42160 [Longimycelium tulufanense]|uniref:Uncharacterized protein n=1 Tax=Longimycelium tulufanense TaxID=907463 RepID=A0A8J3CFB9_9PSEU|nr:hypothetical protein GCM10012275_42160 [Longimycelium tulufanense]